MFAITEPKSDPEVAPKVLASLALYTSILKPVLTRPIPTLPPVY